MNRATVSLGRPSLTSLAALLLMTAPLVGQSSPSVTLFSGGWTLVRRSLQVDVPAGMSTHPLVLGQFDPSSLVLTDDGVKLAGVSYDPAVDERAMLRRNIGRVFEFPKGGGYNIRARIVAMDPERWEITSVPPGTEGWTEGVVFTRPGALHWPSELIAVEPIADVTVTAERGRSNLGVMYQSPGGSWSASFQLFLGKDAHLDGVATINAGVLNLANAEVQLLAGDIGRQAAPGRPELMARDQVTSKAMAFESVLPVSNQSVGEAQLYSLPGLVTFTPGTQTVLPLFEPAAVEPKLQLAVGGSIGFRGGVNQMADEYEVPVEVSYLLERKLGTTFGDLPIPAGGVQVFTRDDGERWQLVGQGGVGHTGAGELMEVHTGTAFDVTAKRTQTEYATVRERIDADNSRTVTTVGQRVVLTNAKDTAVVVEVREDRAGEWQVLESSTPAVHKSSSRVVFLVTVPAKGEATLTYKLRVVW